MSLIKTYAEIPHHLTGRLEIKSLGRRSAPDVSQVPGHPKKRSTWDLKQDCELNKLTDGIEIMSRAAFQRAERKRKRKERFN